MHYKTLKRILTVSVTGILLATVLTACGSGETQKGSAEDATVQKGQLTVIKSSKDLQQGNYYVEVEGGYASPYWGATSFSTENNVTQANTQRVAWFTDADWGKIPTLYKGDCLVFRSNYEFTEDFYFERFLDLGYTVGLCNLAATKTDRYRFSTDERSTQINLKSDAAKLTALGDDSIIVDTVGGTALRSGMISPCGTITGLTKDKNYEMNMYVGTELHKQNVKADSRALYSAQMNTITDYDFEESEIIRIEIPEYFNSGYYSVNGSGIFRYINGNSYQDDPTLMNQANIMDENETSIYNKIDSYESLSIEQPGSYTVRIVYDDVVNEEILPDGLTKENVSDPSAYLTNGASEHLTELTKKPDENALELTFQGEPGVCSLDIRNLYGRAYSVSLIYNDAPEPVTEEETAGEEG